MSFRSVNPVDGSFIADYLSADAQLRERTLASVSAAQLRWANLSIAERAVAVSAIADALVHNRKKLAAKLTQEMGKPIAAAMAEIDKCVLLCRQAPAAAQAALAPETLVDTERETVRVEYHPLGTILAIMPWNFPHWQALRFAIPSLLAGNGAIVKPAESVAGSALLLEECIREAERTLSQTANSVAIPLAVALLDIPDIATVIADARIAGVTLTGSERAGRAVARIAGENLRKTVLELGGSDPFIVLRHADVAAAAKAAAAARTVNSGQSCIAAKRFIVAEEVYDEFIGDFTRHMRELRVGDPTVKGTDVGPIATESVYTHLIAQVNESTAQGAHVLLGGAPMGQKGYFYPPTVLVDIPEGSPAAREELFGPVASVFRVSDVNDAIRLANSSSYGLGASVWGTDESEINQCIRELQTGMVFVNGMVVSDPRYPFGGVRNSGMGRELGEAGYREFTNIKTVRVLRS